MIHRPTPRNIRRLVVPLGMGVMALAAPVSVLAHGLSLDYMTRLPLAMYLVGAATAVALSFAFVLVRDVRAERPDTDAPSQMPPEPIRIGLRAIGLLGWSWIVVQGIVGGTSDADVATLFLWIYGWVGVAVLSAFVGPVWHYLDPFSTLYDLAATIIRRLGVAPRSVADYPTRIGRWPAVVGFAGVVWLELVVAAGPTMLLVVLLGYTALTLAMMARFGRDTWRSNGEVFTVWFRLLGRLPEYALADEDGRVRRRPFASGLFEPGWSLADIVMTALAVGSILFDGLSQTQTWFDVFGRPELPGATLLLVGFLGIVVAMAFAVTRYVGLAATGAGLLPIALGYLIAHYLTYLLVDGQRILVAISDPFQKGWNLFGTAFHQPTGDWLLPPSLVWTIQLIAVVGGHMLGAWGGHAAAALDAPQNIDGRELRARQVPLAVVMVFLTTLTLWSLGQAIVVSVPEDGVGQARTMIFRG